MMGDALLSWYNDPLLLDEQPVNAQYWITANDLIIEGAQDRVFLMQSVWNSGQQWIVTWDDRLCEQCRPMANQVVGLDQPFITPTGQRIFVCQEIHSNCRCTIVPVLHENIGKSLKGSPFLKSAKMQEVEVKVGQFSKALAITDIVSGMYEGGMNCEQIGNALGTPKQTISNWLNTMEIPPRPVGFLQKEKREVQYDDEGHPGYWVTHNGVKIFIREGESIEDAFKRWKGKKKDKNKDKRRDENKGDKEAENEAYESSIKLPLKEGKVTGFPKDLDSAPTEIHLSKKIHELGDKAVEKTKESGEEWGFFLHFNEAGRLLPDKLKSPSEKASGGEWIILAEYSAIKKQDESIQGMFHTHPKSTTFPSGELSFSEGNLGTLLEMEDALLLCKGPQGDYLLALRTQQTPLARKGIGREATQLYREIARDKTILNIKKGLERKTAVIKAVFETMVEICKKYNIALYKGEVGKPAKKVI